MAPRPIWPVVHLPPPLHLLPMQLLVKGPVELWWPAGYGAQPLYNISATFRPSACSACPCTASTGRSGVSRSDVPPWEEDPNSISEPPCPSSSGGGQQATGDGCSSVQRAIGFRTLELVTDPLKKVSAQRSQGRGGEAGAWEGGGHGEQGVACARAGPALHQPVGAWKEGADLVIDQQQVG